MGKTKGKLDGRESRKRKEQGMSAAEKYRLELLNQCRVALKRLAHDRTTREVTADDATDWLQKRDPKATLGAAAGSLFRGGDWEFTGRFTKSIKKTNHSSDLRVWRLKAGTAIPQEKNEPLALPAPAQPEDAKQRSLFETAGV